MNNTGKYNWNRTNIKYHLFCILLSAVNLLRIGHLNNGHQMKGVIQKQQHKKKLGLIK